MFGRKKKTSPATEAGSVEEPAEQEVPAGTGDGDSEELPASTATPLSDADGPADRSAGPFDVSEADLTDDFLDLGALKIPQSGADEVRVQVEGKSKTPMSAMVVVGNGAVQIRAFASPRSGGTWAGAREQIANQISSGGGSIEEVAGDFGVEMHGSLPAKKPDGNTVNQPVRFVGVEGPRWMVQGLFLGEGAVPGSADRAEAAFRSTVVDRGDEPMPPGAMLPLRLPDQGDGEQEVKPEPAKRFGGNPAVRGPSVEETR